MLKPRSEPTIGARRYVQFIAWSEKATAGFRMPIEPQSEAIKMPKRMSKLLTAAISTRLWTRKLTTLTRLASAGQSVESLKARRTIPA